MFQKQTFTNNLRTARKRLGLSQQALAQALFISTQAVSKWERGEAVPDLTHVCRLAEILHVSVDELLDVRRSEEALIAVDGGGTKTEFVLISLSGHLLKRLVLPGSNPNSVTVAGAVDILCRGIDRLQREGRRILGIFVGGAGFYSGNNGIAVEEALQKVYPGMKIRCESDICNVLACAEDPQNAIAVICGTGSVVYATQKGRLLRQGGGGWRLETLGSGYDIGRYAISAALEHRDGTGPETSLTEAVEQKLGGRVWDRIQTVYAQDAAGIAAFAPLVIHAWQTGDSVATGIVEQNCRRTAQLIHTAAEKSPEAKQVILGGSLLTQCPDYREKLIPMLDSRLQPCVLEVPQVWGACLRCAALAGVPAPNQALFMEQYSQEE